MHNIFKKLGASFSTEDFFTACVALFAERNTDFREAFLKWLEDASGEVLRHFAWQVEIQSASASNAGAAVLDMKLCHPEIELWFEHKVDAGLGHRRTMAGKEIDQIEKYLDAASRVMSGISVGDEEVDWPADGPVAGQPRVLLFYISRRGKLPEQARYKGRLHQLGGFGLVWPPDKQLRWKDLWPKAELALQSVIDGEAGDFERTLAKQFLSYWQSLSGMWAQVEYDADWRELLTFRDGERFGFEPLWEETTSLATDTLGWSYKQGYLGGWLSFSLPNGIADQVGIQAWKSRDEIKADTSGLVDEIIELQIRMRDPAITLPAPGEKLAFERWHGVTGLGSTKGRDFLRIHVGVPEWKAAHTQEQRMRAVTGSFIAGLKMFEQATRQTLPGLERI